jgi:hypothetical protein
VEILTLPFAAGDDSRGTRARFILQDAAESGRGKSFYPRGSLKTSAEDAEKIFFSEVKAMRVKSVIEFFRAVPGRGSSVKSGAE